MFFYYFFAVVKFFYVFFFILFLLTIEGEGLFEIYILVQTGIFEIFYKIRFFR